MDLSQKFHKYIQNYPFIHTHTHTHLLRIWNDLNVHSLSLRTHTINERKETEIKIKKSSKEMEERRECHRMSLDGGHFDNLFVGREWER